MSRRWSLYPPKTTAVPRNFIILRYKRKHRELFCLIIQTATCFERHYENNPLSFRIKRLKNEREYFQWGSLQVKMEKKCWKLFTLFRTKRQQRGKPFRKLKVSFSLLDYFSQQQTVSEKPWRAKSFVIYTDEHFKGFLCSISTFLASDSKQFTENLISNGRKMLRTDEKKYSVW